MVAKEFVGLPLEGDFAVKDKSHDSPMAQATLGDVSLNELRLLNQNKKSDKLDLPAVILISDLSDPGARQKSKAVLEEVSARPGKEELKPAPEKPRDYEMVKPSPNETDKPVPYANRKPERKEEEEGVVFKFLRKLFE